jgi:hypothetical protein
MRLFFVCRARRNLIGCKSRTKCRHCRQLGQTKQMTVYPTPTCPVLTYPGPRGTRCFVTRSRHLVRTPSRGLAARALTLLGSRTKSAGVPPVQGFLDRGAGWVYSYGFYRVGGLGFRIGSVGHVQDSVSTPGPGLGRREVQDPVGDHVS